MLTRRQLIRRSTGLGLLVASGLSHPAAAEQEELAASRRSPAERDELTGWEEFCEGLKKLGRHIVAEGVPTDRLTRAEGVRCLSRLTALGLDRFLEFADPRHPDFYDLQTAVRKYLGDNPDQTYRTAAVDGRGTYRVRGTARGAAGVEIGVYAGSFRSGEPSSARRLVGMIDETTLRTGPDGAFEVQLGPSERAGNWIPLQPDAQYLLIRTYFWDRSLRRSHPMPSIERLDAPGPADPLAAETLMRGLMAAVAFAEGSLEFWRRWMSRVRALEPNRLHPMPDDGTIQTPRGVRYLEGCIRLDPEDALVLETRPRREANYWNLTLQNFWGETPDWRERSVSLNNRELIRRADGSIRIIVSARHPGVPNWLDMAGHRELYLALRWRGAPPLPEFQAARMRLQEVA